MSRKEKRYNYIYKTTNILTDKYYIGIHSTDNLEDGYIGSGKRLWYSVKKYGKENHKVEILEFLPNRRSLIEREISIVNDDLLKEELCMNLNIGGYGGFEFINNNGLNHKSNQHILGGKASANKLKTNLEWKQRHFKIVSDIMKKNHKEGKIRYDTFKGKKHTEETKKLMSQIRSKQSKGEGNSQYGTCWITNGRENKKIKKTDILPKNWWYGRNLK